MKRKLPLLQSSRPSTLLPQHAASCRAHVASTRMTWQPSTRSSLSSVPCPYSAANNSALRSFSSSATNAMKQSDAATSSTSPPPDSSSTPSSPPSSSLPSKPYLSSSPRSASSSTPSQLPNQSAPSSSRFRLTSNFLDQFRTRPPPFGYNGLGELVYLRTYSRKKANLENEQWYETVERVVNGTYNMQKQWIEQHRLGWNARKAQTSAQEMYRRIFEMKFLPPGRGLWAMGSPITEERRLFAALNNCAFVSTEEMKEDPAKPFTFLMDASMLGVGVGFDTKGAGSVVVKGPSSKAGEVFVIPDSREGWVEALRVLLDSFFHARPSPSFDFSHIRPFGTPIQGFGGLASGPASLEELLQSVQHCLERRVNQPLTTSDIVDLMNYIGRCVVAGNVRRCLPGDALVHTRDGLIPIRDVVAGQQVLTSIGFKRVTEHVVQGPQELVKIVTQDGMFRCTPTHRMAVLTDLSGKYEWKRADQLQASDRLMSPRTPIPGSDTQLPLWKSVHSSTVSLTDDDIVPPPLDTTMAWFNGLFMRCSGYIEPNYSQDDVGAHVELWFGADEGAIAAKAKAQLERFGRSLQVELLHTDSLITLRCRPRPMVWYLDQLVKPDGVSTAVPAWILQATLINRQAFIAGVIDANESVTSHTATVVTTSSRSFARDVQRLLYSCGVESRLEPQSTLPLPPRHLPYPSHTSVHLITSRSVNAVRAFPELCKAKHLRVVSRPQRETSDPVYPFPTGLPLPAKRRSGSSRSVRQFKTEPCGDAFASASFYPVEVSAVVPDVVEDTFDISVEGQHEFFVDGLLSHNTAEIAFGDAESTEYLDLKNYAVNPHRAAFGWTSNNSVFAKVGMDYGPACERVKVNGEPGFAWLENMQKYGRMNGVEDNRDHRARGGNPCLEQTLESYEMCCLVETFPSRHADLDDFQRTLKFAYLYAKTVTLGKTHWPETNRVMLRNRRIGCSVSGIAQFISQHSLSTLQQWLTQGYDIIQHYDRIYSDWLAIPRSIKTTSVKPSGTVSLLAGATPGMHYPESRFYLRRVRLASNSSLIDALRRANYHIEPVADGDPNTAVVSIPIDVGEGVRTAKDVSMWEQLALAAFLQRHWADNQVSCTVTFDPKTEGEQIAHALNYYQYQLKGISFLPRLALGAYKQMPYEEISEEEYKKRVSELGELHLSGSGVSTSYADRTIDRFCDGDTCAVEPDRSAQAAERAMEGEGPSEGNAG